MFRKLTLEQRLIAVNLFLFLVIGLTAFMLMTASPEVPAPPPIGAIKASLASIPETVEVQQQSETQYPNFGVRNAFPVLVPTPTPEPTPPPTPVPDPSLAEAIKDWKLGGFGPNMVFMSDLKTREDWIMDLDDPATRSKTIRFNNQDMVVTLEPPLDLVQLKVTFSYTGRQGEQTVDKFLYSD